jgi:hypothetical protein
LLKNAREAGKNEPVSCHNVSRARKNETESEKNERARGKNGHCLPVNDPVNEFTA